MLKIYSLIKEENNESSIFPYIKWAHYFLIMLFSLDSKCVNDMLQNKKLQYFILILEIYSPSFLGIELTITFKYQRHFYFIS